jgi:hypothetical protein
MANKGKPLQPANRDELNKILASKTPERELQGNVQQFAEVRRWRFYHTHRSQHSPEGFPDCIMIRRDQSGIALLVYELKRQNEKPTPAQQDWLDDFEALANAINELSAFLSKATHFPRVVIRVGCWRPMEWLDGTIEKILTDPFSH